jgi:ribosome-associated heat shock protein Hsp15
LDRQRLDKWLWHARLIKTRPDAVALIERGRVRINGERQKTAAHNVRLDDVITVTLDRTVRVMQVTGFAERRGDASSARLLYTDMQDIEHQRDAD